MQPPATSRSRPESWPETVLSGRPHRRSGGSRRSTGTPMRPPWQGYPPVAEPGAPFSFLFPYQGSAVMKSVLVIGGGLAGSEAAWQISRRGFQVRLYEMRPDRTTLAHKTSHLAEIVCSNSFKSNQPGSAPWLLKEELKRTGFPAAQACLSASSPQRRLAFGGSGTFRRGSDRCVDGLSRG